MSYQPTDEPAETTLSTITIKLSSRQAIVLASALAEHADRQAPGYRGRAIRVACTAMWTQVCDGRPATLVINTAQWPILSRALRPGNVPNPVAGSTEARYRALYTFLIAKYGMPRRPRGGPRATTEARSPNKRAMTNLERVTAERDALQAEVDQLRSESDVRTR